MCFIAFYSLLELLKSIDKPKGRSYFLIKLAKQHVIVKQFLWWFHGSVERVQQREKFQYHNASAFCSVLMYSSSAFLPFIVRQLDKYEIYASDIIASTHLYTADGAL